MGGIMATSPKLVSVEFEVFGRVQGVFFRKYTQQTASSLGLVGWVKNTERDTVVGVAQGPEPDVSRIRSWLQTTGSPKSKITRCQFRNEREMMECQYQSFTIDRGGEGGGRTKKTKKTKSR